MHYILPTILLLTAILTGCNNLTDLDAITRRSTEDAGGEDESASGGSDSDLNNTANNNRVPSGDVDASPDTSADAEIVEDTSLGEDAALPDAEVEDVSRDVASDVEALDAEVLDVETPNAEPPEVSCPTPQVVTLGETVSLSASGVDPDGGDLVFAWSLVTAPDGAMARPEPPNGAEATFIPDALGDWTLRLCGTDDEAVEACCEASVEVTSSCNPPPGPGLAACGVSWDRRPIMEFHPLPVGLRYDFSIQETGVPIASVTAPGQNYLRPAAPIGLGGAFPGDLVTLSARTCRAASPTCCSDPEVAEVRLVEACTTPVAPTTANIIISEYLTNGDDGVGILGPTYDAGEAVEIANLSNCPVTLDGVHLRYCSSTSCGGVRYMNFGSADIIPPRGVFVVIRAPQASTCDFDFLPESDNSNIFGIRRSSREMVPVLAATNNNGGWFGESFPSASLRLAQGAYATPRGGQTIIEVEPYISNQPNCESVGFSALGACGEMPAASIPTEELGNNQVGRFWHPCDAVLDPNPPTCLD